jgi:cytochrome c oxidase subunit II
MELEATMTSNRLMRTFTALCASGGAWLAGGLALANPQPETSYGLPHDASVDGHRIDWLIKVTMGFVTILFVIMCIWIVWACLKHDKGHKAEYDHGDARHQVRFAAGLSALIFFVVDGNLWVNSTLDVNDAFWNFDKVEADPATVRIEVDAHQWAWDARYAGPDGKFNTPDDIVTLNEIPVPVGRPILLELASADVIHSFYLPNFRVKRDAMPGMINRLWFEAKETGDFEIGCAQHCGTNHYKMRGFLRVLSQPEYDKWAAEASKNGERGYNKDDELAHWGWDWKLN